MPTKSAAVPSVEEYGAFLARVKSLTEQNSINRWALADLLIEGYNEFSFESNMGDVPRHLLIGRKRTGADGEEHCPSIKHLNFWKDVAAETGNAVSTLKELVKVGLQFPNEPGKRFPQLSFTHHAYAVGYERRYEYLRACIVEGEKPHTVEWLDYYIRQNEGEPEVQLCSNVFYIPVPDVIWKKVKDLSKYHRTNIRDLLGKVCLPTIEKYLEAEGERISLETLGIYEGKWPFEAAVRTEYQAKPKKHRRRARMGRDPVVREKFRQAAIKRWARGESQKG